MVASLAENKSPISAHREPKKPEGENRIIRVLMSRLDSSMTFGENMIFMLNRAGKYHIEIDGLGGPHVISI